MTLRSKRVLAVALAFAVVAYFAFTAVVQMNQRAYEQGLKDGTFAVLNAKENSVAYSDKAVIGGGGDEGRLFFDSAGRRDSAHQICDYTANFREAVGYSYNYSPYDWRLVRDNNGAGGGCNTNDLPWNAEAHQACLYTDGGCGSLSNH